MHSEGYSTWSVYLSVCVSIPCSRRTWDWDEILRIHATNFLGYTRRASAAQLRINIHTRSRVKSIAHPVLTIPYVWRVTHEYINEGLKQGQHFLGKFCCQSLGYKQSKDIIL